MDAIAFSVKGAVLFNEGYDVDDSTYLTGMDELDTLYSAGVAARWNLNGWEIGLEAMQDVSGEHDGLAVEMFVERTWLAAGFEFTSAVSLSWMSSDMVDYFYGVSARETRADRSAYAPGESWEAGIEIMIQRPLFGNFSAVGILGISTFGSDIKDSPLVDEDYAAQLVLGLTYAF